MGGSGSGNRWRYGTKSTTDDYRSLDVRRWAREGMLRPGCRAVWTWRWGAHVVGSINMRSESGFRGPELSSPTRWRRVAQ